MLYFVCIAHVLNGVHISNDDASDVEEFVALLVSWQSKVRMLVGFDVRNGFLSAKAMSHAYGERRTVTRETFPSSATCAPPTCH